MKTLLVWLLLGVTLIGSGCQRFYRLRADVADWNSSGRLVAKLEGKGEVVQDAYVALWTKGESGGLLIQDIAKTGEDGRVAFLLRKQLDYYLGAFKDEDGDGKVSPREPVWYYGKKRPRQLPAISGSIDDVEVVQIDRQRAPHLETLSKLRKGIGGKSIEELVTKQSVPIALGLVADLKDDRFAREVGDLGLWEPARFVRDFGVGVYFLQPFDRKKIPVLFVNGASGTPRNFEWIIKRLDTERYQPWFYFGPTGIRIEESARILHKMMAGLAEDYRFRHLNVVGHSMGGLTSRRFVQMVNESPGAYRIDKLVTISTPWNGHEMARLGVSYAPEPVPSWLDMEPGSEFLETLLGKGLVSGHLLLYGNKASDSYFLPDENDGTVSVSSMTDQRALAGAQYVVGLKEDHMSILRSKEALRAMERFFGGEPMSLAAM